MAAIELDGVTKRYGDVVAVEDLDLAVQEGEVFGFLGPNGAGKSTTIDMVLDFVRPSSGSISVLGHDAQHESAEVRQQVGVLPEGYGFDDPLTAREYVEWAVATKGVDDDPRALLDHVGLTAEADRLARDFSKGMGQRLAMAMALAGDPPVLILDEPSSGLDPNGIQTMRSIVRDRAEAGTTVFFSSHILSEVEAVSDRVGVLHDGSLVAVDSLEGLRRDLGGGATIELDCAQSPGELDVAGVAGVVDVDVDGRTLSVDCRAPSVKADVVRYVARHVQVEDLRSERASLESLFAELTGGGRDAATDGTTGVDGSAGNADDGVETDGANGREQRAAAANR